MIEVEQQDDKLSSSESSFSIQVFVDMDGVIADFQKGIELDEEVRKAKEDLQNYMQTIPNPFPHIKQYEGTNNEVGIGMNTIGNSAIMSTSTSNSTSTTTSTTTSSSPTFIKSEVPTGTFATGECITLDILTELLRGRQDKNNRNLFILKEYHKCYRKTVFQVAAKPNFFRNLEPIDYEQAKLLLEDITILTGSKPHLLTAPVNTTYCASEKEWWAEKYFVGLYDKFYCTANKEEKAWFEGKQGLLIDDRIKFTSKFEEVGGLAIHHYNHEMTRKELQNKIRQLQIQTRK